VDTDVDEAVLLIGVCSPPVSVLSLARQQVWYFKQAAPFLALPWPPSAQDWRDAAGLVAPGDALGAPRRLQG